MAEPNRDAALAAFKQTFRQLAPYRHRYEVFRDFVTMAACSLHNSLHKDEGREEEYLRIIGQYKPDDQQAFPKLMAQLVAALDEEPRDILGPLTWSWKSPTRMRGNSLLHPSSASSWRR